MNAYLTEEVDAGLCLAKLKLAGRLMVVVVVVLVAVVADTEVTVVVFLNAEPIISEAIMDLAKIDKYLGHWSGKK